MSRFKAGDIVDYTGIHGKRLVCEVLDGTPFNDCVIALPEGYAHGWTDRRWPEYRHRCWSASDCFCELHFTTELVEEVEVCLKLETK